MRVFISIDLPKEVKDYLFELEKEVRGFNLGKVNWVFKKNLHLTLKFLGEVSEDKALEIKNNLKNIKFKKFKLKLTEISFYPSKFKPNVIWVGVELQEEFIKLQQLVDAETIEVGDLKLGAHITFGRIKSLKEKKLFLDKISKIKIKKLEFEVNSFDLFNSELSASGPSYNLLEKYSLE